MKKSLLIFTLLFLPISVYANAGTPLIWASAVHLYLGNIFVGFLESYLAKKSGVKYRMLFVVIIIIVANFASMLVGVFLASSIGELLGYNFYSPAKNEYIWQNILLYVSLTITSFFVEFPFFLLVLKKKRLMEIIKNVVRINIISAVCLLIYYILFQWGMVNSF